MEEVIELKLKTIEGEGIVLRPLEEDDLDDLVENINDPLIAKYTWIPHPYGKKDAVSFLEESMKSTKEGRGLNLSITLKDDNRVIGGIGMMKIDRMNSCCDIGYWVGRKYWGRGIASEAISIFTDFIFDELHFHRISAVIFAPNTRSESVLKKNGFQLEGIMKERYLFEDGFVDGKIYARIASR